MKLLIGTMLAALLPMAQAKDTAMSRAGFMVGCWELQRGAMTIREVWREATPDFLIGNGTTTSGGAMREFEFTRVESKEGAIDYVAQPNGQPPTRFALDPGSKRDEAIFVNMQHDFPKRVVYQKSPDGLLAFIDGGAGTARTEFPMKPCKAL